MLGTEYQVFPGSLVGRLVTADVMLSDPRVSEAHALVSLRGRSLRLLALRGLLLVDALEVDSVELRPGLVIELAKGLTLTVESVELPSHALLLCGAVPDAVELRASVYSLVPEQRVDGPAVRLVVGFVEGAEGHLWYSGGRLWTRLSGRGAEPLNVGSPWSVAGCAMRVIRVPLGDTSDTEAEHSRPRSGFVLHARYTTVHVQHARGTSVITGKPANLISELVRFAGKPVPWDLLAREIWSSEADRSLLRKSFDSTMRRLRAQLHDLELREDLVRLDGSGNVELVLMANDRMVDEM